MALTAGATPPLFTAILIRDRYTLTPYGRRMALFLTKVHSRVLLPGLQALDLRIVSQAPPPLRSAYTFLDQAIQDVVSEAKLAA